MSRDGEREPRAWLITGGGSGLGRAVAEAALRRGDRVAVTDRILPTTSPVGAAYPGSAITLELDVTNDDDVAAGVDATRKRFGRIDVLVNCAGYGLLAAVEEADDREVRRLFEVNFFGTLRTVRHVLPVLREQRSGHIVNFSSVGGRVAHPLIGLYSASKFAVEGLGEALSAEVEHLGIRVTTVAPGGYATNFGAASTTASTTISDYDTVRDAMAPVVAAASHGLPDTLAASVLAIVDSERPPRRFAGGRDAQDLIAASLSAQQQELSEWAWLNRTGTI